MPPPPWHVIWDGIDVFDLEDMAENTMRFGKWEHFHEYTRGRPMHVPGVSRVGVQVLGLQDTGTNLLNQLLYKNFGGQVAHYDSSNVKDELKGVWKHANMAWVDEKVPEAFNNLKKHSVVPLVMVRNPLSWLQSIKKAPYELTSCVKGVDWLQRPCVHKFPAGYVMHASGVPVEQATFLHLSGIWGQWTETYVPVLKKHFDKVIVVRYEDLVLRTRKVMKRLAKALNLVLPENIDNIASPAKDHGEALGHAAAAQKIRNKEFLPEFSEWELKVVCDQLKFFNETIAQYSYNYC